jgi:hypothetical protein
MKDPVALAYSGRIAEATDAALAQASSSDDFLVRQGLEALAVLGQQHGVRTNAAIDSLLVQRSRDDAAIARKAFEAAMGVGSRALEEAAVQLLAEGRATWEVLRYVGEWPSHALGRALVAGWEQLPRRLVDQALLTSCAMPVANPAEARELGVLAALKWWAPEETPDICAQSLTDDSPAIRQGAADLLATLDPSRLVELSEELGATAPEALVAAKRARDELARRATKKAGQ